MSCKKALGCFLFRLEMLVSPFFIFGLSFLSHFFLTGFETQPWLEAPFEIYSTSSFLYRKYISPDIGSKL